MLFIAGVLLGSQLCAQDDARVTVGINESWQFTKDDYHITDTTLNKHIDWQPVDLPHTWNAADVMNDAPGYYRGVGWYKKTLLVNSSFKSKTVFLHFEGANQEAQVYVNGKQAGSHTGGYTAFSIPVSDLLRFDDSGNVNEIVVKVNNANNPYIPPLSADFTFYGGIYRDVYLVAADNIHFTYSDNASKGIYISTPQVSQQQATVHIAGSVSNSTTVARKIKVITAISNAAGKEVATVSTTVAVQPGAAEMFVQDVKRVVQPHLWSPEDPYLYTVSTRITDLSSGAVLDEVTNPLGFRYFQFDANKGFILNGQPYKLVGASRHQDYEGLGNAVSDELARHDIELLKKMGGNFLRVAHYPQDPSVLEACDRLGILTSVEIPVVNEITESDTFYRNCENMQVEMIRQHFNHPSIVMWCYMNEVLLRPHFNNDKERQKLYFIHIAQLAKRLDSITRKEDPYRSTMIACHGDLEKYRSAGITAIPMVLGWNLYPGWYSSSMAEFPKFLDRHHAELPNTPLLVTEYGADADPRIRSFVPVRFDKSVEYTTTFHQYYITEMLKRPFVAGAMIWNLADFNSETRTESMPHINNKGLLMWNRVPKDPYYLYQAFLLKKPFVAITSAYWTSRSGIADSTALVCYQPIQVASNLDSVTLSINGKVLGTKKVENGLCAWKIPFSNGRNDIAAWGKRKGQQYTDRTTVDFILQPYVLTDKRLPFQQVNILLGAARYYIDEGRKQLWIPDQAYRAGSWGYTGGKPYNIAPNGRLPYGTDKNINGTDDDPIYQSQQTGIQQYRLDVPNGAYELTLHFAELQGGAVQALPYNLSPSGRKEDDAKRVFDVYVNDVLVLEHFNIAEQYGGAVAVAKKIPVTATGNKGVRLVFKAITGEPVLNALQLVRLY